VSFFILWLLLKVFAQLDLWPLLSFPILLSAWFFFETGVLVSMALAAILLLQARPDNTGPVMTAFFTFGAIGLGMAWALRRRHRAHSDTLQQSLTDSLTGLYNYGFFVKALDREIHRAGRYGGCVTVVMFDIDHFKMFNDRFGHQAGNQALKDVAEVIRSEKRGSDIAARFGGEEFVVLIPDDERAGAETADRLRRAIAKIPVEIGGGATTGITVSVGVAGYPNGASSREELIERVDQLLYRSKKNGRNRVTVSAGAKRLAVNL
jgi:diguanylate cyclase (GGDEF)-like protein